MKIAIISSGCLPVLDGVTVSLSNRVKSLNHQEHEVLVFCPDYQSLATLYPDWETWTGDIFPGVHVVNLPSESFMGVEYERNISRRANPIIRRELDNFRPDIVHVDEPERISMSTWNAPGVEYAREHGIPSVAFYRTNFVDYTEYLPLPFKSKGLVSLIQWMFTKYVRWVYHSYDVTLVSNPVAEQHTNELGIHNTMSGHFLGIDTNSFQLEQQGADIDPARFLHNNGLKDFDNKVVLVFVGRLSADKNWQFTLDSLAHYSQRGAKWLNQVAILVAGDGELRDVIQGSLEELGLPFAVLGRVSPERIPSLLAHSDIHVTTSEKETLGLTVVESFAAGKPVIAPRAGGVLHSIRDGENGLLFEPHNTEDFGRVLSSLVTDETVRHKLGKQGRQDATKFSQDAAANHLVDAWKAQIKRHRLHDDRRRPMLRSSSSLAFNAASDFVIANRIQAKTGYWGIANTSHQFCEPHYAFSPYVAEACNALSSLVFVWVAIISYSRIRKRDDMGWMKLACLWLGVIGVGSMLFHATMWRSMQIMDEGPMLGLIVTCTAWKMDKLEWTKQKASMYQILLWSTALSFFLLYLTVECYELFYYGFCVLIAFEVAMGLPLKNVGDKSCGIMASAAMIIGKIFWLVENGFCETVPSVWPLHIVWHFLSALGAYYLLLFNMSLAKKKDRCH